MYFMSGEVFMALTLFMYHRILPRSCSGAITTADFERQLDYIVAHYRILRAEEVEKYITGELRCGGDCAALSFDDAWIDNAIYATPILRRRYLSALLAVSAGFMHDGPLRHSETDAVLYRDMSEAQAAARSGDASSYMNRAELAAMQDSGCWRLEVHGTRHEPGDGDASVLSYPQNGMDARAFREFLAADLNFARDELAKITGRRHRMLFWPWGHYSTLAVETARECGFLRQFTVAKGVIRNGDDRPVLPRIGVPPRWNKFTRNCLVFRHPLLTAGHECFHRIKVCFDDRVRSA